MELNRTSRPRPQSHLKGKKEAGNWLGWMFLIHYLYIHTHIKTTFKYWDDSALGKKKLDFFFFFSLLPTHPANPPNWQFCRRPGNEAQRLTNCRFEQHKEKNRKVILEGDKSVRRFESVWMLIAVTAFRTRNVMNPPRRLRFRWFPTHRRPSATPDWIFMSRAPAVYRHLLHGYGQKFPLWLCSA